MNRTSDGIKRTFLLYKNGRLTLPTKKAIHLFLFFLSVCVHIGMNVYLIILRLEDNNRGMCWRFLSVNPPTTIPPSSVVRRLAHRAPLHLHLPVSHKPRVWGGRECIHSFFPEWVKEEEKAKHITRVYIKCLAIKDERVKSSWSIGESRGGSRCREIFNCGKITFFPFIIISVLYSKADNITHNTGGISSVGICISTSSGSTRWRTTEMCVRLPLFYSSWRFGFHLGWWTQRIAFYSFVVPIVNVLYKRLPLLRLCV